MKTYLFYTCNRYKERSSSEPQFTFTDTQSAKVIKHISENPRTYFERNNDTIPEQLKNFVTEAKMKPLTEVLNSNTDIFARCEEINNIKNV